MPDVAPAAQSAAGRRRAIRITIPTPKNRIFQISIGMIWRTQLQRSPPNNRHPARPFVSLSNFWLITQARMKKIRIGTRGSKLALVQTGLVADALRRVKPDLEIETIDIKTIGDRKQGTPEAAFGDKKDWIYDLELALLANNIDLAVHSGKDVPPNIEKGTAIFPVLKRATPLDAFIGKLQNGSRITFEELPDGAVIGTASLRRKASLLRIRPDLKIVDHRGNVTTRLKKLDENPELSGIVLAAAGLERLEADIGFHAFPARQLLPALNQGTLVVQSLGGNAAIKDLIQLIRDNNTVITFEAERACAEVLEGDCHSAVGIFAEIKDSLVVLSCRVMTHDGKRCVDITDSAPQGEAAQLGKRIGQMALERGAKEIIEICKKAGIR